MKIRKKFTTAKQVRYVICMSLLMMLFSYSSYSVVVKGSDEIFIDGINWYPALDEQNAVAYWPKAPKTCYSSLSNTINVMNHLNNSVNIWKSAGISSSITTTPSNASIMYYAGTKAQLNAIGFFYASDDVGSTYLDMSQVGYVNNSQCDLYEISSVISSTSTYALTNPLPNGNCIDASARVTLDTINTETQYIVNLNSDTMDSLIYALSSPYSVMNLNQEELIINLLERE